MANVDPTIALSAKAPDTMTGLGQMLNVARGAQAYQQLLLILQRSMMLWLLVPKTEVSIV